MTTTPNGRLEGRAKGYMEQAKEAERLAAESEPHLKAAYLELAQCWVQLADAFRRVSRDGGAPADEWQRPGSKIFNQPMEPESGARVFQDMNLSGENSLQHQSAIERRAHYRTRAQAAKACSFRADDDQIREAYSRLAKSWAALADSVPSTDGLNPKKG